MRWNNNNKIFVDPETYDVDQIITYHSPYRSPEEPIYDDSKQPEIVNSLHLPDLRQEYWVDDFAARATLIEALPKPPKVRKYPWYLSQHTRFVLILCSIYILAVIAVLYMANENFHEQQAHKDKMEHRIKQEQQHSKEIGRMLDGINQTTR